MSPRPRFNQSGQMVCPYSTHHRCSQPLIAAISYCGPLPSRLPALTALCPRGSLPSWLSALPSISLTLLPVAGAAPKRPRMFASARPSPPLCTHRDAPSTPNQDDPPQPFSPIPGSMIDLCYISFKRQHGLASVLARCGVQSS